MAVKQKRAPTRVAARVRRPVTNILSDRGVDLDFYRAFYPDARLLDEDAIADQLAVQPERLANPVELFARARQLNAIPSDFVPVDYIRCHPDLAGFDYDWQAIVHYWEYGKAERREWTREFDPDFYAKLYFPLNTALTAEEIRALWNRAERRQFANLKEVLWRAGFDRTDWLSIFNPTTYVEVNGLQSEVLNDVQATVHFVEKGIARLLPIDSRLAFDPAFYRSYNELPEPLADEELYRHWLRHGALRGEPTNEAAFLHSIGCDLHAIPEGFDWQSYLAQRPDVRRYYSSKWGAFRHFVTHGVYETPIRIPADRATTLLLLRDAADRCAREGRSETAQRLYDRAFLQDRTNPGLLQHMGDLALRSGRPAWALYCYREVESLDAATLWTYANAAQAALELQQWEEAVALCELGLGKYPRSRVLHTRLRDAYEQAFQSASRKHGAALEEEIEGPPESTLEDDLQQVFDSMLRVHRAQYGAGRQGMNLRQTSADARLKVVVLANQDLPQCTYYRVAQKLEQLRATDVDYVVFSHRDRFDAFRSAAATADIAVFYRVAASVDSLACVAYCRSLGIPTVYEIDDLIFDPQEFPPLLASYNGAISTEIYSALRADVEFVRAVIRLCDYALSSTDLLGQHLSKLVRRGECATHRNGLSQSLEQFAQASRATHQNSAARGVTIFYGSGTKAHGQDFLDQVAPALDRILEEHPEVRFWACGYVEAQSLVDRYPDQVRTFPFSEDRDVYMAQLMQADICLSVLEQSEFNDCKSEIKWLEPAAFSIPSIVTDVEGFREVPVAGEEILRVEPTEEAWYQALRLLIERPDLRRQMGEAARRKALSHYGTAVLGSSLSATLARFAGRGDAELLSTSSRTPRVLIVNIFFPPQAIGGATRVVWDQIRLMRSGSYTDYDVAVFCGNDEPGVPYSLEAYHYDGVPVFSISTPLKQHMDWIAWDENVRSVFDTVLERVRPDLVHFHCIQRLTAAIVDCVLSREIPYVVSVHDAWWISDHQFLVDQSGKLCLPWDEERYDGRSNPHSRADSLVRRLRLAKYLCHARNVLAVSNSFASIYEQAGVPNVVAVPNGLSELPPLEPSAPSPGRVRIGHVGGMSSHKGFSLLKTAILRGRYRSIELVIVDHALPDGEERSERWGDTPVRIIGKVAQRRVGWLYGQFDVLAAPSIWPESYGLVAREAAYYGRWVIASDRGAIGDDITPDVNGFIVDVSDDSELSDVLRRMDMDPGRYSSPPQWVPRARTADEQVAAIVDIYNRILEPIQVDAI